MDSMLKEYPKFEKGEIEEVYNKISKAEKKLISDYLDYRRARGITSEDKVKDVRRYMLHLRHILGKEFKQIDLADLRNLLGIINSSYLSGYVKNTIKTDLKNFLKYQFPDWSSSFANLEDIRLISNARNEKKLNSQALLQKEDIEKVMRHEPSMFLKAFFMTQYEGGLRTQEVRFLKWDDIKFDVDGDISEVSIYSTKTKKARTIFVKDATFYLKKLKEEQENLKEKGIYVFHSRSDINKPVIKTTISMWFRAITKKALGREGWAYLLRHSRATELYRLAKQGKIAKDTAIEFMGHSDDMSKVYQHFDSKEIKEMLKSQVYKTEDLPPEKRHELEEAVEKLKGENEKLKSGFEKDLNDLKKEQDAKFSELTSRITEMFSAAKKSSSLNTVFLKAAEQDKKIEAGMRTYIKKRSA